MKNIIILIMLIAGVMGMKFYGFPAWRDIQLHRAEINQLQEVQEKAKDSEKVRSSILARLREIPQSDIDKLQKMFPEATAKDDMYYFFQQLVERSNMKLESITLTDSANATEEVTDASSSQFLSFALAAEGDYQAIRSFLNTLENNQKLMDILNLDIQRGELGKYKLSLKGRMYYGN